MWSWCNLRASIKLGNSHEKPGLNMRKRLNEKLTVEVRKDRKVEICHGSPTAQTRCDLKSCGDVQVWSVTQTLKKFIIIRRAFFFNCSKTCSQTWTSWIIVFLGELQDSCHISWALIWKNCWLVYMQDECVWGCGENECMNQKKRARVTHWSDLGSQVWRTHRWGTADAPAPLHYGCTCITHTHTHYIIHNVHLQYFIRSSLYITSIVLLLLI